MGTNDGCTAAAFSMANPRSGCFPTLGWQGSGADFPWAPSKNATDVLHWGLTINPSPGSTASRYTYRKVCAAHVKAQHFGGTCHGNKRDRKAAQDLVSLWKDWKGCIEKPKRKGICKNDVALGLLYNRTVIALNRNFRFMSDTPVQNIFPALIRWQTKHSRMSIMASVRDAASWARTRARSHPDDVLCERYLNSSEDVSAFDVYSCIRHSPNEWLHGDLVFARSARKKMGEVTMERVFEKHLHTVATLCKYYRLKCYYFCPMDETKASQ